MKVSYFIIGLFLLTGCASISEYNRGCRDGVTGIGLENASKDKINSYCNGLDSVHKDKEKLERPGSGRN